jgi:hypothetical protein
MTKKTLFLMLLLALFMPWAANAQKALPYSYGFENNDLDSEGWTAQITHEYSGIQEFAAHDGNYGFSFNYFEVNAYLMSPLLTGTDNGVDVSFYYAEYSNQYGDEQFCVGYTTDENVTDPSDFTYGTIVTASTSWAEYTNTFPAGTKYVAIKYMSDDIYYLFLDDFSFMTPASCSKPTELAATLTPGDGTVATLSWTENGTATVWQICINDDETQLIDANTNPFPLSNLTPEMTYTAKVRACCGNQEVSAWSNTVPFIPTEAYTLTVNDGTDTNEMVPIYGYYVDETSKSQFIIPATDLSNMQWGTILRMTFFASNASANWGNAVFSVRMSEVGATNMYLYDFFNWDSMEEVYTGNLFISGNQMGVIFTTPYYYRGGNLLIGFDEITSGSYASCSWYGVNQSDYTAYGNEYNSGSTYEEIEFLPKIYFEYTPGEEPSAPCLITDFPVSWDFEVNNTGGTSSSPWPACWTKMAGQIKHGNGTQNYAHSGQHWLNFHGQYGGAVAVLPELGETLNGKMLSLYARNGGSHNPTFSVGFVTDPHDNSTFVAVKTIDPSNSYYCYEVFFGEYEGDPRYIAIRPNIGWWQDDIYIDDITLDFTPLCVQPANFSATLSGGDIELIWSGEAEGYEVACTLTAEEPDNDDIVGSTIELPTAGNPFVISNLTPLTDGYYVWVRSNCGNSVFSSWEGPLVVHLDFCIFKGDENEYWSNSDNWQGNIMPQLNDTVLINGICLLDQSVTVASLTVAVGKSLTIQEGQILTVSENLTNTVASGLVIEEGGQLLHHNDGVQGTVKKSIMPYTTNKNGWYLITSPLEGDIFGNLVNITSVANILSNNYDLYYYHEPTHYWINYKDPSNSYFTGGGYLYANSEEVTLEFAGEFSSGSDRKFILLSYTDGINLKGFNLIGNPFVHNVTSYASNYVADGCYVMNEDRSNLIVSEISEENPLKPCEGFFVKATWRNSPSITFNPDRDATASPNRTIRVELSDNGKLIDRLIVKKDGQSLEKLSLNNQRTKLFAIQDHQEMAIVSCEGNEQPVNFKAAKNGEYTINVNTNGLEFNYLHLIDNLTGVDVDLLVEPSYTFEAKTSDYASRFRLVFSACGDADSDNETFAYYNGSEWVVANGENTTLQVVDAMGRIVYCRDGVHTVSTTGMAPGVYVLRLIQSDDVKTQKIVIQ